MSRVHDALRRAEQLLDGTLDPPSTENDGRSLIVKDESGVVESDAPVEVPNPASSPKGLMRPETGGMQIDARSFLARCKSIPFRPAPEAHLINPDEPHDGASEEFRSLRTRLNHMQAQQDLRVIVCTSASPAEGKTFTACNLALAQAQLELPVLLADLDLRRPVVHQQFQCERSPGFSDFLLGEKSLEECIRHVEGTNLYILPAGSAVRNPLELLNMRPVRYTLDSFRKVFNWVILDTPPLLFSADANLLATITDGIILVVRIGSTTYDSVVRAIQTLCENNVLGIVANGARAGELYSKYTYYYTKSEGSGHERDDDADEEEDINPLAGEKLASAPFAERDPDSVAGENRSTDASGFAPSFGADAEPKGGFFSRFRSRGAGKPKKEKAPVEEDEADDDDE
jgi:receptor protein-tyrosine kinase